MAEASPPPPPPPPSVDPRSGFCSDTKTFHSLRPRLPLPPYDLPLSLPSYAFSLLVASPLLPLQHPAFIDSSTGVSLSYPQFQTQVQTLASSLRAHLGLSKGHVAFIICPARLEIPVLYFALLSIGAVVSPANPVSSPAEISRQFQLTNPSVAFATSSTASNLPRHVTTVLLDSPHFLSLLDSSSSSAAPNTADPVVVRQSDPATILFSSGTTGRVKGVVLTHRNFIAEVAPFRAMQVERCTPAVQMVAVPMFHVYGFLFCAKSVAVGETTVIVTERFEADRMLKAVQRFHVTHLAVAPPALVSVVRVCEGDVAEGGPYDLSSLEAVACGGAPISVELIRRLVARFPNVRLAQGYGLTESTGGIFRAFGPEECQRLGASGRLIPNCEAKVVDPVTGIAMPPCTRGELWLRGPTIMKGYIGDLEATSEILDSEGWLKTGDLGYIDEDGFLVVVDRLKELIKYKGYQVPPAELEHLLETHPEIIEAAVIPYPDEEAGQIPMAFVVRQTHSILDEAHVIDFVAKQVAPYKKIRCVSFVNSIPKNSAGKILRKDLIRLATSESNSKL